MRSGATEPGGEVCPHGPQKLGVGSADAPIMPYLGSQSTIFPESGRKPVVVPAGQPFSQRV